MGNQPSAHQPLERGFRRARSFRFSKRERSPGKRMDRLRRSFRDSFRRRREPSSPEASRPHQWQADESAVRSGNCAFQVKYLGCTEVFESRGMQTCEEALKTLRTSRRRPIRAVLHVSGDGLRVVDDETKDLIVDQTIEKVSFCAPDRNCEKGFSYICRDGTTRRWMCHGFLATKESGDRLSHAVGCAFAACLERKQRRDKECGVTMTFDQRTSTFTRTGSFRQSSLTERMQDPRERAIDVVPMARQIHNPHAIERPHATPSMLERQGSFRGFDQLNHASPFKRQLSLRNDFPSNYERARSHSLEPTNLSRLPSILSHQIPNKAPVSPIPEISPSGLETVAALCQKVTQGLSLLSSDDFNAADLKSTTTVVNKIDSTTTTTTTTTSTIIPGVTSSNSLDNLKLQNGFTELTSSTNNNSSHNNNNNNNNNNNMEESHALSSDGQSWQDSSSSTVSSVNPRLTPILNQCCPSLSPVMPRSSVNNTPALGSTIPSIFDSPAASPAFSTTSNSSLSSAGNAAANQFLNRSPVPPPPPPPISSMASLGDSPSSIGVPAASSAQLTPAPTPTPTATSTLTDTTAATAAPSIPIAEVQPVPNTSDHPKAEQWLSSAPAKPSAVPPPVAPRRAPPLHARAMSLGSAMVNPNPARQGPADPFDAAWADTVAHRQSSTTNPFIMPNTTQAFQVQL